ncbi:glycoside hydrolase family 16 protein [Curtobacterium sp. L1-20]|uniref:glycoside hydrolase family 16 protein n=1 Tax=Curtobacterium sp. L1-20 TaxID=3138181 RepID=UPI003B5294EC
MNQHQPTRGDHRRRRTMARGLRRAIAVLVVSGATVGVLLALTSTPSVGRTLPAGIGLTQTPTATPTLAQDPHHRPTFFEGFDTPAAAGGQFASTYANAWQPYAEGTSGKYYSGKLISAHDGVMDVAMDGEHGAAGVFGPADSAWAATGGTYSIRAKVVGGDGNGAAIMLWPTSNVRSEGEINFPEGGFDSEPVVYHHSMIPGHEGTAQGIGTGVTWRKWHTYTMVWKPGKSVSYYLDGDLLGTITTNVPTTPHRYTFQIGNVGSPGHVLIDWVSRDD